MFDSCQLREFKTKYAWKKHLLKDHKTALVPQYMCELCALSFSSVDKYPDREVDIEQQLVNTQKLLERSNKKRRNNRLDEAPAVQDVVCEADPSLPELTSDLGDFFEYAETLAELARPEPNPSGLVQSGQDLFSH